MFEDSEVEGLLVRLNTPGYRMIGFDTDPADQVGLETKHESGQGCLIGRNIESQILPCYEPPTPPSPPWLRERERNKENEGENEGKQKQQV